MDVIPRRLWQVAGVLAIVHVVLIPISLALSMPPLFADGTAGIRTSYVEAEAARVLGGGMLEALGFLLMVPVVVFLGRALGRRTAAGAWAARTGAACGVAYITVTFAVGFPAGAASLVGAQHGLDLDVALAINNVRTFGYFLSLMLLGGSTIGFAVAALTDGLHRRWLGWFGVAAGIALLASTPLAAADKQDLGTLVWLVWFLGAGVLLMRHPGETTTVERQPVTREDALDHA